MIKKLKKGEYLDSILRSDKTVFSVKDIALLWREVEPKKISLRLNKYIKSGKLIRLRRGFYAKDKNYNHLELANKIYTPSYISFETILSRSGLNFQKYESIFVASYISREIKVKEQKISFIRLNPIILTNIEGIEIKKNLAVASKERAFLDRIYVSKDYHFDNLSGLNWDKVFQLLPIYSNLKMIKRVNNYFKYYKHNYE